MHEPPQNPDPLAQLIPPSRPPRMGSAVRDPLDDLLPPSRPPRAPKRGGSNKHERPVLQVVLPLLALAGICALGIRPPDRPASARVIPLADGGSIALEAITYGRNHQFVRGNWVQKLLVSVLPDQTHRWIGGAISTFSADNDGALVFWTVRSLGNRPLASKLRVAGVDESENEVFIGRRCYQSRLNSQNLIEGWLLPALPRRGKKVELRVYESRGKGNWARVFELEAPNPTPGPHPKWEVNPLPQTEQDGEHSFTLTRLVTGVAADNPRRRAPAGTPAYTVAHFRDQAVEPDEAEDKAEIAPASWYPERATILDATGNVLRLEAKTQREGDGFRLLIPGRLWPSEPVWRLRVNFSRTAGFAAEEKFTFQTVPLPGRRSTTLSQESATLTGTTVVFDGIAGPEAHLRGAPAIPHKTPLIYLRIRPYLDDIRVTVVDARDEHGRSLPVAAIPVYRKRGAFAFPIESTGNARRIDLTVAVHHSRVVEFTAKPSRP